MIVKKYYDKKGREIIRGITEDMDMTLWEMAETLGIEARTFIKRLTGQTRWRELEIRWLTEIEGMDPALFLYDEEDLEEDLEIDPEEEKNLKKMTKK